MDGDVTCGPDIYQETLAIMSESGSRQSQGQSGTFTYQNGVWLTRSQGARSEKYQKWTEDHTKSQVQRLDKEEHSSLVKLSGQCLEVRTELRDLKQQRFQLSRSRHGSSDSADGGDPVVSSSGPLTALPSARGLRKSVSSSSLLSSSSGYSSLSSATSLGRRSGSSSGEGDRGGEGRGKGVLVVKGRNPDVSAQRVKNLHSARTLSKLNNNMHIEH